VGEEYFFFFTWREALFCFQQMTRQRFCSRVVTRQWNGKYGKLFCSALAVALENVALSQHWNFICFSRNNCLLVVQQAGVQVRDPCSLTIVGHINLQNLQAQDITTIRPKISRDKPQKH